MWRESASMKRAGGFIYENWFWAILCGGYLWMDNSQKLLDVLGYIYRIQACGFMCDISCDHLSIDSSNTNYNGLKTYFRVLISHQRTGWNDQSNWRNYSYLEGGRLFHEYREIAAWLDVYSIHREMIICRHSTRVALSAFQQSVIFNPRTYAEWYHWEQKFKYHSASHQWLEVEQVRAMYPAHTTSRLTTRQRGYRRLNAAFLVQLDEGAYPTARVSRLHPLIDHRMYEKMSLAMNPRISANSMLTVEGYWCLLLGPNAVLSLALMGVRMLFL